MIVILYDNLGLFGGIVPWHSSAWNIHGGGQEVCDMSHVLLIMTELHVGATGLFFHTDTDCFQGDVCSYNFCEFQICILIALIAVWHSYFFVAHSCIIWFDGCTDPAVKSFAWFTEHLHRWNSATRKQFVQTKMQFLFAWVWASNLFGKYAITLFWLSSS